MDTSIYIGIALLVAVVLFFTLGKKKPTAAKVAGETEQVPLARESVVQTDSAELPEGSVSSATAADTSDSAREVAGQNKDISSPPVKETSTATSQETTEPIEKATPSSKATKRDISGLRRGLALSRESDGFFGKLKALFGKGEISPEIVEQLEEVLLTSDVGVETSATLLERIRSALSKGELKDESAVWEALRFEAKQLLACEGNTGAIQLQRQRPTVVLLVGVNGAGKTTTIGKLATKYKSQGLTCVLAAGDTFRAAAVQQLVVWGNRIGCEVVRGKDGSDPGAVIFDAVKKAEETGADVVLADTAGRLHTKANLMAEMQKIARTTGKALAGAPHEILLVIDSTNGQNALAQAKEFKESLPLNGIVLTKLDGTAKGGVVLGIANTLKLPVRYVGLGERPDDLHEFAADDFVEALLGKEVN